MFVHKILVNYKQTRVVSANERRKAMNIEKFTQKSVEAIKNAEKSARETGNPTIETAHILLALFSDREGLIPELSKSISADTEAVLQRLKELIGSLPRVSGGSEVYLSRDAAKILEKAEEERHKMGDEFTSVEHIMLAIFESNDKKLAEILKNE